MIPIVIIRRPNISKRAKIPLTIIPNKFLKEQLRMSLYDYQRIFKIEIRDLKIGKILKIIRFG